MVTSGNVPSAGMVEFASNGHLYLKTASTYAEERRSTVGVFVVRGQVLKRLHRATENAIGIRRIATLPVEPEVINHL